MINSEKMQVEHVSTLMADFSHLTTLVSEHHMHEFSGWKVAGFWGMVFETAANSD